MADAGINLERGIPDRDSLDILTGVTGGRSFSTIDLDRAMRFRVRKIGW